MTWTVSDLADKMTKLAAIDPAIEVHLWNPEWIEAISLKGFDMVDGKLYLHCGWGPSKDDPNGVVAEVE